MKRDRPRAVILPHEAGYHLAMPRQFLVVPAAVLTVSVGCTARMPSPPTLPTPSIPAVPATSTTQLRFSAGTYRYRLLQTAEIQSDQPADTIASTIRTEAIFLIRVVSDNDSTFHLIVSIDSIHIATGSLIPPRSISQMWALDSVLHITFTPTSTISRANLPDSLCAYGQFISTARLILVPELPLQVQSPLRGRHSDSTIVRSCHAGAIVEGLTVRE